MRATDLKAFAAPMRSDELSTSIDSQFLTQVLLPPGCRTSNISVVSESHVVPSGGDVAEHWPIDMSHVPESHAVVTSGHPRQVPEAHMSFVVAASPSSHLRVSTLLVRARFQEILQLQCDYSYEWNQRFRT